MRGWNQHSKKGAFDQKKKKPRTHTHTYTHTHTRTHVHTHTCTHMRTPTHAHKMHAPAPLPLPNNNWHAAVSGTRRRRGSTRERGGRIPGGRHSRVRATRRPWSSMACQRGGRWCSRQTASRTLLITQTSARRGKVRGGAPAACSCLLLLVGDSVAALWGLHGCPRSKTTRAKSRLHSHPLPRPFNPPPFLLGTDPRVAHDIDGGGSPGLTAARIEHLRMERQRLSQRARLVDAELQQMELTATNGTAPTSGRSSRNDEVCGTVPLFIWVRACVFSALS